MSNCSIESPALIDAGAALVHPHHGIPQVLPPRLLKIYTVSMLDTVDVHNKVHCWSAVRQQVGSLHIYLHFMFILQYTSPASLGAQV